MATIEVHVDPTEAVEKPIADGLRRFNEEQVGSARSLVLVLLMRDGAGEIMGGIKGRVLWGWVYVEMLWVREEHRGHGVGGALLDRLESEAVARGARGAVLLSASWQAPEFYSRRGYATVASFGLEIPASPDGGDEVDYLLVKTLSILGRGQN